MAARKKPRPKGAAPPSKKKQTDTGARPEEAGMDLEIDKVLAGKRKIAKKRPRKKGKRPAAKAEAKPASSRKSGAPPAQRSVEKQKPGKEWRSLRARGRVMAFFLLLCIGGAAGYGWWRIQELEKRVAELSQTSAPTPTMPVEKESSDSGPEAGAERKNPDNLGLEDLRRELAVMRARNELSKSADEAISTGSRFAFKKLERLFEKPAEPGLKDAANAEIMRVESHYITTRRYRQYAIPVKRLFPDKESENQISVDDLMALLMTETNPWEIRARAAQLLGGIRGDERVPAALVSALATDPDLYVVQEALHSFGKVTGYRPAGVFDTRLAEAWWQANEGHFKARRAANP